jgi:hypothetical protein
VAFEIELLQVEEGAMNRSPGTTAVQSLPEDEILPQGSPKFGLVSDAGLRRDLHQAAGLTGVIGRRLPFRRCSTRLRISE